MFKLETETSIRQHFIYKIILIKAKVMRYCGYIDCQARA